LIHAQVYLHGLALNDCKLNARKYITILYWSIFLQTLKNICELRKEKIIIWLDYYV